MPVLLLLLLWHCILHRAHAESLYPLLLEPDAVSINVWSCSRGGMVITELDSAVSLPSILSDPHHGAAVSAPAEHVTCIRQPSFRHPHPFRPVVSLQVVFTLIGAALPRI